MSANPLRSWSRKTCRPRATRPKLCVVDYAPLTPVISLADAVLPGSPQVWPEAPNNIAFEFQRGESAPVEDAIRDAAHVVECELVNNRVVAASLETRGALGEFDAASGRLHLTASAAGAHAIRDLLASAVFRFRVNNLRVSIPDVGGGFGMKNVLYPEWVLVLWAARRLRRPVLWIGDRSEEFVASVHGRDSRVRARLALDRDGKFLALDADVLADMGAYVSTVAPVVPTMAMGSAMGGVYDIPLIAFRTRGVFTNTTPVDAYRGAGKPEANYLIERLIDIAAGQLGMDAVKLRRKNIVRRFPHRSAMGLPIEQRQFRPRDRSRGRCRRRFQGTCAGFAQTRQVARPWACLLSRNRARPAQRGGGAASRRGRPDRSEGRHAFQRPEPRDHLCADRRGCAWRAARALHRSGRATPTRSTAAAAMAARARCIRAAPRC